MQRLVRPVLLTVFVATVVGACARSTPPVAASGDSDWYVGPEPRPAARSAVVATRSPTEAVPVPSAGQSGEEVTAPEPAHDLVGTVISNPNARAASRPVPPPDIGKALIDHYPPRARTEGVEGYAMVRATLSAEGVVTNTTVRSEVPTGYGFGDGCTALLLAPGRVWQPARDAADQPIEYQLNFRCTFLVGGTTPSQ